MNGFDYTSLMSVFPPSSAVSDRGRLMVGGCDTVSLAQTYGTPLYVFDEAGIRARCAEFRNEFGSRYPDVSVIYACKAFTCLAMLQLITEEGLGLDVVSGGEIEYARVAGSPLGNISFAGNNKAPWELELALNSAIRHIVVDNLPELELLAGMAGDRRADILLRLSPGIDPHTHKFNTTGTVDSKFGLPRPDWDKAVLLALGSPCVRLRGLHFHLGSGLFEVEPYLEAIGIVLEYAADIRRRYGFELEVLSIGGGYGVAYHPEDRPPSIADFAEAITSQLRRKCSDLNLSLPQLVIEPGRAIVAQYGISLYTVGVIKEIPGIRTYVSVDGGMGDNIRYPLYGFVQETLVANRAASPGTKKVTISGKYCESGDILVPEVTLPDIQSGDILAMAGSGAYAVPMASNYNGNYRPAVVFVKDGTARLVRCRETIEDLTGRDI